MAALAERTLIAAKISLAPMSSLLYVKRPLEVANATEAVRMPGSFIIAVSIPWTQDEHVIPSIYNRDYQ